MIKNPFSHLVGNKETVKTFDLIRLQGKSYRFIKNYVNTALAKEKLNALEWGILGLLYENSEGQRYVEIAQSMGVEPPFITELVAKLLKQNLIHSKDSEKDRRAKVLSLTEKGKKRVQAIESELAEKITSQFADISSGEWKTYKEVMNKIISITATGDSLIK
jgi:DNA-binding MarR family transcriptional regulator